MTARARPEHPDLQRLATEYASYSVLITTCDLDSPGPLIVYANDEFTRMTQYRLDEVIGRSPRLLQGQDTDRAVLERLKRQLTQGERFVGCTTNYRKDGSPFLLEWTISAIPAGADSSLYVAVQKDLSSRDAAEAELATYQRALIEASNRIQDLLRVICLADLRAEPG